MGKMSTLDAEAEAKHVAAVKEVCYNAMMELRDTIKPNFHAINAGYDDREYARETIIRLADKKINKLCADHLRKAGR